jgi:hypothetical protein
MIAFASDAVEEVDIHTCGTLPAWLLCQKPADPKTCYLEYPLICLNTQTISRMGIIFITNKPIKKRTASILYAGIEGSFSSPRKKDGK